MLITFCLSACTVKQDKDVIEDDTSDVVDIKDEEFVVSMDIQGINLEKVENARELGGYPTKDGKHVKHSIMLRTGELFKASEEDLNKLVNEYNLKTIIDFREQDVIDEYPDPVLENVDNIHIPVMDEALKEKSKGVTVANNEDYVKTLVQVATSGQYHLENTYINILDTDAGKAGYTKFFRVLLENKDNEAILFHCSYGKDRTGIAAVLFLTAMNVDEKIILEDFALTNKVLEKKIEYMKNEASKICDDKEAIDMVGDLIGVPVYAMEYMITYVNEKYGSIYQFIINELGISEEELTTLRSMYLE